MSLFPARQFTVESILDKIKAKNPDATIQWEGIEEYRDLIMWMETQLHIKRVALRAITLPQLNRLPIGKTEKQKKLTFHYACFRGTITNPEIYVVNYFPQKGPRPIRDQHILNDKVDRHQLTKKAWQDLKACVPEGFAPITDYVTFEPDPEVTDEDKHIHDLFVEKMTKLLEDQPTCILGFNFFVERFIKTRFEEYLTEYHETHNEYYLARADFYRKLTSNDMTQDHIILIAIVSRGFFDDYFAEKMLRDAYTEKIGSF